MSLNCVKLIRFILNFFLGISRWRICVRKRFFREDRMKAMCTGSRLKPNVHFPQTSFVISNTSLKLWHHTLGHLAPPTRIHILKSNNISCSGSLNKCLDCLSNKSHKLPFSISSISSSYPLEILYSDLWGPTPVNLIDGFYY